MDGRYRRMENSLKETANLGRQVLERARRREVNWVPPCDHGSQGDAVTEVEHHSANLKEAFDAMDDFMRHATQRCTKYHSCLPCHTLTHQEVAHRCRFHRRKFTGTQDLSKCGLERRLNPISTQDEPRDISIEVAPGTYSVSAGSPNAEKQTCVVNISPGQTVDITFTL
ncbi:hypothetical protein GDO86_008944 [Hymenochirus boettgeri]|uniref:A-kinase-interacting protein 1 n=1 Tax=Hymenochirus boettgeri TaxID=247094 RepID=A0A8T2IZR9_9PIPI|nr:hypothetical protein GDO86_008944 [Hymenochirus boettgeri]